MADDMADDVDDDVDDVAPPAGPTWLTYPELADRLGLPTAAAAAARARRAKWPKRIRNDTGQAEVEVPADALPAARRSPPDTRPTHRPDNNTPDVAGDAVRAAVAPLQALLEREAQDRRTLQAQADALRDQLAQAQLDAAQAIGTANTERAKREAAEAKAADLQHQLDKLQAPRPRPWWRPW